MYPSLNAPWLFIKWQLVKGKINLLVPREWFVITLPGKALAGLWNLCEGWLRAVCPWFSWGLSQQSKSVFSSSRPQPLWLTSTDPYKYAGLKVFKNTISVVDKEIREWIKETVVEMYLVYLRQWTRHEPPCLSMQSSIKSSAVVKCDNRSSSGRSVTWKKTTIS